MGTMKVINRITAKTYLKINLVSFVKKHKKKKITVFWNVTQCRLVESLQSIGVMCFSIPIVSILKMEAARTPKCQ
jgi:5-methylthioribose kinase